MELLSTRLRLIPLTRRQLQTALLRWTALERELQVQICGRVWQERLREIYRMKERKTIRAGKQFVWYTYWQIVDRAANKIVGEIGFKGLPDGAGRVEVGYQLWPEEEKKGYMSEALQLLTQWAFEESGVSGVAARVRSDNAASKSLLEKSGFLLQEKGAEEYWLLERRPSQSVRGRFAPSPSGEMHLGNAWAALLAWLQVRAQNGTMLLRIEDLDPDRSKEKHIAALKEDLKWLGLDWDEGEEAGGEYGPYRQSQRRQRYQAAIDSLTAAGLTYPCRCTRAQLAANAPHASDGERVYPGTCRAQAGAALQTPHAALRLIVPPGNVDFVDLLQGTIRQDVARQVGDFVLQRADGVHAYQLAVVVDDAAMAVSHVLRGDDLLSSTPRQLLLYRLLSLPAPQFSHVPLLVGADGHRLSKRHQDLSLAALRRGGASPQTVLGWLGWQAGLLPTFQAASARDLIAAFTLDKLPRQAIRVADDIWQRLTEGG